MTATKSSPANKGDFYVLRDGDHVRTTYWPEWALAGANGQGILVAAVQQALANGGLLPPEEPEGTRTHGPLPSTRGSGESSTGTRPGDFLRSEGGGKK